jgi:hypothetical protein
MSARVLRGLVTRIALALALATTVSTRAAADPAPHTKRVAVVIGANDAAPGRQPLRYAHTDAQRMADVLVRVGKFERADVQTLLDPKPAELLAAVDRAAAAAKASSGDSLFVFYYSGHSDGQSVYPHGEALALADLRDRLAKSSARIRVGILDTCRGGSWTRAKGFTVGPALDPVDVLNVTTEGTALLSSSSGIENAHEADAMKGSFFTHHLAAGLLGAADKSGDGNVTLQEVFEYAKERTVRDSARLAATAQHPSFDLSLRGRQDVVLTQVGGTTSALEVTQQRALEIIHLATGVTVVETPPGRQQVRLALPAGRYLVRVVLDGKVLSREVAVPAGGTVAVSDTQLEVAGNDKLVMKGAESEEPPPPPRTTQSTPSARWFELRLGAGASTGPARHYSAGLYTPETEPKNRLERSIDAVGSFTYGITNRLALSIPAPAFAYRIGAEGNVEVIPRAGFTALGYSAVAGVIGTTDAGVASRTWVGRDVSLVSDVSADFSFGGLEAMRARASLGATGMVGEVVTLSAGVGWAGYRRLDESVMPVAPASVNLPEPPPRTTSSIVFGAVQSLGFRPLPLVQVHLSRRFSLDAYASWSIDLKDGAFRDRYLAGFSWAF